jgi:endonuclease III related protein
MSKKLYYIYRQLLKTFGFQNWWPAQTPFEVCIGAVLTQNTSWNNVELAINNLKKNSLLDAKNLYAADPVLVRQCIRPAGYFNQKAAYLKNICRFFLEKENKFSKLKKLNIIKLRSMLLDVKGIGKETADSIILYAVGRSIFVIDAYTRRIYSRIGIIKNNSDYDDVQKLFHLHIKRNLRIYRDYHAQIVMLAINYCNKVPKCLNCPLCAMCNFAQKTNK